MLIEKEASMLRIILELSQKMKETDLGIPIQSLFKEIKRKGIYVSSRMIGEKLKRFESMELIQVLGWNVHEINKSKIGNLLQQYSETFQKEKVSQLPKEIQQDFQEGDKNE